MSITQIEKKGLQAVIDSIDIPTEFRNEAKVLLSKGTESKEEQQDNDRVYSDLKKDNSEKINTNKVLDSIKKGDTIKINYDSSIRRNNESELKVRSKNTVKKGKFNETEKITFDNIKNPTGVKFYAYKRKGSERWSFAIGDLAISNVKIEQEFTTNSKLDMLYRILNNKYNNQGYTLKELYDETISMQGVKDGALIFSEFAKRKKDSGDKRFMEEFNKTSFVENINSTENPITKKYKFGDKYSSNFDYNGMLNEYDKRNDLSKNQLLKLRDSLEDVNYHTEAKIVNELIKKENKQTKENPISKKIKAFELLLKLATTGSKKELIEKKIKAFKLIENL